jgi:hypothetical protein
VRSLAEGQEPEAPSVQPRPGSVLISNSAERSHLPIRNGLQAGPVGNACATLSDADRELPSGTGHRDLPDDHAQASRPPLGVSRSSTPHTLIKSKPPWNDHPKNASLEQVTRIAPT